MPPPLTSILPFLPRNARPESPKRLVNLETLDENLRGRGNSLRPAVEPHQPNARLRAQHEGHRGGRGLSKVDSLLLQTFTAFCSKFATDQSTFCEFISI